MNGPPIGILLLDKPLGLSSNAALQRVRRLAGGIKAGHTGSLDPLASGMLPICLGEATKFAGEMLTLRKCYHFGVQLGERSDTGDAEGAIVERCPVPPLTREAVEAVLLRFHGVQQQVPPMYSALKREGEPLYRLARRGLTVERSARSLVIDSLQLSTLQPDRLELRALCSKGTYVRVLAEDLARALGTCGRLYRLRREYVEPFAGEGMLSLTQLEAANDPVHDWPLLPVDSALMHLPALQLTPNALSALVHGQPVYGLACGAGRWRLYDAGERFLGLGESDATDTLRVRRLFSSARA
ncbi:MAG TPA: tRNA pseudouridine(55) synthase TruB, partial [Steroidobacteraceae bacterium]|nr:tRNA pseudouridine(55) synthase TruB [Steroidobacteraceae bacterium]